MRNHRRRAPLGRKRLGLSAEGTLHAAGGWVELHVRRAAGTWELDSFFIWHPLIDLVYSGCRARRYQYSHLAPLCGAVPVAEQREALAAPVTYEPVPTHKLFPVWEWILRIGLVSAVGVVGFFGYRYWIASQNPPSAVKVQHFAPVMQLSSDTGLTLAPAISHAGTELAFASDREGPGGLAIWTKPLD